MNISLSLQRRALSLLKEEKKERVEGKLKLQTDRKQKVEWT
jgi:hypothetical protein